MARLYLHCALCNRKQANGLLSGSAWGRLTFSPGSPPGPGLDGAELRACPTCISRHPNWNDALLASLGLGDDDGLSVAQAQ